MVRTLLVPALVIALASSPAWAGPGGDPAPRSSTRTVAGQALPVRTAEPAQDETFVALAASELAAKYRARLLAMAPDAAEAKAMVRAGKVDPRATKGTRLALVRVRRDRAGQLFLYRPCDAGSHARHVIGEGRMVMLGVEPLELAVHTVRTERRTIVVELDRTKLPVTIDNPFRYRLTSQPGLYEVWTGDGIATPPDLMMLPEEAARLDVVVHQCKKGKRVEFDFDAEPAKAKAAP